MGWVGEGGEKKRTNFVEWHKKKPSPNNSFVVLLIMWYLICSENRRRSSKTIQFVHDTFLSKTKWSKINSFQRITQINIFNVVFICPWLEHLWKKKNWERFQLFNHEISSVLLAKQLRHFFSIHPRKLLNYIVSITLSFLKKNCSASNIICVFKKEKKIPQMSPQISSFFITKGEYSNRRTLYTNEEWSKIACKYQKRVAVAKKYTREIHGSTFAFCCQSKSKNRFWLIKETK